MSEVELLPKEEVPSLKSKKLYYEIYTFHVNDVKREKNM